MEKVCCVALSIYHSAKVFQGRLERISSLRGLKGRGNLSKVSWDRHAAARDDGDVPRDDGASCQKKSW